MTVVDSEAKRTVNGVIRCRKYLKQVSMPVDDMDIEEVKLRLINALDKQDNCAGLAAIQIGIPIRMAIYRLNGKTGFLINPEIVAKAGHQINREGCMSFPGTQVPVERRMYITVKSEGMPDKGFNSFGAAVIQHEIDHMNGITVNERKIVRVVKSPDKTMAKRKAQKKARRNNR